MEFEQLDIGADDQDRIIYLCAHNTDFMAQCTRKGLIHELFSSDVRQKLFRLILRYFDEYGYKR